MTIHLDCYRLSINRCPAHGVWSVSLDQRESGTRLTPTKCCGSWKLRFEWLLEADQLRDLADHFLEAAADMEASVDAE